MEAICASISLRDWKTSATVWEVLAACLAGSAELEVGAEASGESMAGFLTAWMVVGGLSLVKRTKIALEKGEVVIREQQQHGNGNPW